MEIGGTRLDKIELSNGTIIEIRDMDLLREKEIIIDNSTHGMYETDTGQCFSYLNVKKDKAIHCMRAGTSGYGKPYVTLQTGVYDEEHGNLIGNTVSEYHDQIQRIEEQLKTDYGIIADFESADLKYLEVNRTFQIDHNFDEYSRVIKLILAEMPRMNICSMYGKTSGDNSYFSEKVEKIGTYTAWNRRSSVGKSKQCKVVTFYDKKRQIKGIIYLDGEYMRFEIKLVGIKNIEKAFGTSKLYELTDEVVNSYFESEIENLIVKPLTKWKANRNTYIKKLIREEREKDMQHWIVNVLRTLSAKEVLQNGKPCLLDISELDDIIDRLKMPRKSRIKNMFRKQAEKYEVMFCRNDTQKLDEIIENLLKVEEPQSLPQEEPQNVSEQNSVAGLKTA